MAINKAYAEEVSKLHDVELDKIYGPKQWTAAFDSRSFCLPDIWEVRNYILWCQQEAAANSVQLAGAEVELINMAGREKRLKMAIDVLKPDYDYIFIDCPPS
ncbi:MAG: AAA family ATPase, partial [Firmicutes bacterium]|nr:AAA family ATPase [Bacillota bacterium]